MRHILISLSIVALLFATSPSWVAPNRVVKYDFYQYAISATQPSTPSAQLEFKVTTISGADIKIDLVQTTGSKVITTHPTDNASASSGQFWFDPTLLAYAGTGSMIGDWEVMDTSTQTFADSSWDTITLQKTMDGAVIEDTYDTETGLLLSNKVTVSSKIMNAIFKSTTPSFGGTTPAPPPAPTPSPSPTPTPSTPPAPPSQTPSTSGTGTTPTQPTGNGIQHPTIPSMPPIDTTPTKDTKQNIPCCPFIFVMLFVGAYVLLAKRNL